jgi:dienelactone hydrolase
MGWIIIIGGLLSILALEAALIFLCFSERFSRFVGRHRRIAFVICQGALFFLFIFGAYIQLYFDLSEQVLHAMRFRIPELESTKLQGDHALIEFVRTHQTPIARPDFEATDEFRRWQGDLRSNLIHDVFRFDDIYDPVEVRSRVIATTQVADNIERTLLAFESFDGTEIPAYLFRPASQSPRPTIVVVHGHVRQDEAGIAQAAGLTPSYHHGAALELAKAGYVTLTFELRGFGYLGSRVNTEHRYVAYNALVGGSFYKAIIARDIKYATEFLRSLKEVDRDAMGITGVSLGGDLATTYAALDERMKVVVAQGHGGMVGPLEGLFGAILSFQPHNCLLIPGFDSRGQHEDMFLLLAPRPALAIRGTSELPAESGVFADAVRSAYESYQVPELFEFKAMPGGHEYFTQPAIEFFNQHLRGSGAGKATTKGHWPARRSRQGPAGPAKPPSKTPDSAAPRLAPPGQPVNVSEHLGHGEV